MNKLICILLSLTLLGCSTSEKRSCPEVEITSNTPVVAHDRRIRDAAYITCWMKYRKCLKTFTKTAERRYAVMCGGKP